MLIEILLVSSCFANILACKPSVILPELERRARNYFADGINDPYVNDYILADQWYSVRKYEEQYLMPDSTKIPDYFSCGGSEPIYIKGTHPDVKTLTDKEENVTACLRSTFDDCDIEYHIQVRICDTEVQYFLVSAKAHSSYCFDPPAVQGNSGKFSPPPTTASLGRIYIEPELVFDEQAKQLIIDAVLRDTTNYDPRVIIRCMFDKQDSFFYSVNWYLNGNLYKVLGPTQDLDELSLHERTFIEDNIPLGFTLKCGVRVLQDKFGRATTMNSSADFFAGIKILSRRVDIPKTSTGFAEFKLTIPVGCRYNSHQHPTCDMSLSMFDPRGYTCDNANLVQVRNSQRCGQDIRTLKIYETWDPSTVYRFNISTTEHNYNDPLHFTLQLRTSPETDHKWWKNYQPDDIQVIVLNNKVYERRVCSAHIDPHMTTADGYSYDSQEQGEYLLYRNTENYIEVQIKTDHCYHVMKAECICGLIVRAGADVFAINLCNKRPRFIEFVKCGDGGILKVVEINEKHFQVFTPIATWVDIKFSSDRWFEGFMNVDIMMAPKDLGHTEGLCGYFDGDKNNDLKRRDGSTERLSNNAAATERIHLSFSRSWKLKDDENLFRFPENVKSWTWDKNRMYCVCEEALLGYTGTTARVAQAFCSPSQYLNCHVPFTKQKCLKINRRKRSVNEKHDREIKRLMKMVKDRGQERKHLNYLPKRSASVQNVSKSAAEAHCGKVINSTHVAGQLQETLPGEGSTAVIDQCAFDAVTVNDLSVAEVHVDALNSIAHMTLKQDPVFVANNSATVKEFVKSSCPSNCSQKGKCSDEGTCDCDMLFHGSDCSIDERVPLIIDDMEGGGLCNLTDGDGCACFYVRTRNLLRNFTCNITEVSTYIDETEGSTTTATRGGKYEDIFTGQCCVPSKRRTRSASDDIVFSTRYDVSISNDGSNFGPLEPIHVFDSTCQNAVPDSSTRHRITLKDGTCFIDGFCALKNEVNLADSCDTCQPSVNAYNWTKSCEEPSQKQDNLGVILGATFGTVASVLVAAGLYYVWNFKIKSKRQKNRSIGDSQQFSSIVMPDVPEVTSKTVYGHNNTELQE